MHNNTFKQQSERGFGLIELLVSISIVVLVTSIIMVRHTSYNGAVLLRSEAYSIALTAREVQLSTISAAGMAGDYRNVSGLYLDTRTNAFYRIFQDVDGDFFYDVGEEVGARNNINPRFQIDEMLLVTGGASITLDELSIVFERPNFDARFFTAGNTQVPAAVSAVQIVLRLRGTAGMGVGERRVVEISRTGQITVQ